MANRVQIAIMRKGENRFRLYAHGAPYSKENADEIRKDYEARGAVVRFLTLPKGA